MATWNDIEQGRLAFADYLDGLSVDDWTKPSLCDGWTVGDVAAHMLKGLRELAPLSPHIGDVRGCGLFFGVEWVTDLASKTPDVEGAVEIANRMKDRGFLMSNQGAFSNVLKIRPPLVFERQHAELFLSAFAEVLEGASG